MTIDVRNLNINNVPNGTSARVIAVPQGHRAVSLDLYPGRQDVVLTNVDFQYGDSLGNQLILVAFDSAEASDQNLVGKLVLADEEEVSYSTVVTSNRNYDSGE